MKRENDYFGLKLILYIIAVFVLFAIGLYIFINYPNISKFIVFVGIIAGFVLYCRYILSDSETAIVRDYPLMEISVCNNGKYHQRNGAYIEKDYVSVGKAPSNDIVLNDIDWLPEKQFCIETVRNDNKSFYYIQNQNLTIPMYRSKKGKLSVLRNRTQLYSDTEQNHFRINGSNDDNYIDIIINLP